MNEELAITVGAAARSARARLGLTQADVAERVGIAMEVYSRMERGKVLPSVTTLRRLCLVLHAEADVLLGLADEEVLDAPPEKSPGGMTGEAPPRLRRLVRVLRAMEPEQLRAVAQVVNGVLGLARRRRTKHAQAVPSSRSSSSNPDLARLDDALYTHDAGALAVPLDEST